MQANEDSKQFKKALRERDLSALKKIAKGDLHNHAALGGSPKKKGIFPPDKFDGYKGMKQYINTAFYPEMSFLEGYKRYVEATCQQAIEDGVIYLETSIDYRFLRMFKDIYSAFEYLDSLKNKYKNSCKINYDLGLSRGSFRDFSMAKEIISDSVFSGIDLYGDESNQLLKDFADLFIFSRNRGKICKAHIGEFCSASEIFDTVNILSLHEVQHGVHIIDSDDIIKMMVDKDVAFNVCVTSNIKTGGFKDYKNHPVRKMFDDGLLITINSDDVLLFYSSVSDEFLHLYNSKVFNENELDIIRKNGLRRC